MKEKKPLLRLPQCVSTAAYFLLRAAQIFFGIGAATRVRPSLMSELCTSKNIISTCDFHNIIKPKPKPEPEPQQNLNLSSTARLQNERKAELRSQLTRPSTLQDSI